MGLKIFRKKYAGLGILRHYFRKVPIMALLATIIPNVLSYIGDSLYLWAPTRFYKHPLNRLNIVQLVVPITKPGYCELDFLIPKTGLIPKIMVFINKIDNAVKIAIYFYLLLLSEDRD